MDQVGYLGARRQEAASREVAEAVYADGKPKGEPFDDARLALGLFAVGDGRPRDARKEQL
jgi:hypothetical protein